MVRTYVTNDLESAIAALKVKKVKKDAPKPPVNVVGNSESKDPLKIVVSQLVEHMNERN